MLHEFTYSIFCIENFIDGHALVMLPKEFNHLVPQSGIRMKRKAMIEKYSHGFNCGFEVGEKVHTLPNNKNCMIVYK